MEAYVNGVIYSNGQVAVGAACVSPLLELTNGLCEPLYVSWVNRAVFNDGDEPAVAAGAANRLVVAPGDLVLLTNFYPSLGFQRSLLILETECTGLDTYVFNFAGDAGYYLQPSPNHWRTDAGLPVLETDPYYAPRKAAYQTAPAYALTIEGNLRPKWKHALLFPAVVAAAPAPVPAAPLPLCHPSSSAFDAGLA